MLRRIKKDVENELSDKIEIMVYCPLTSRQKMLYAGEYERWWNLLILFLFKKKKNPRINNSYISSLALRKKIRIEDLLHSQSSYQSQTITSNLMNLVMQFRKVIIDFS